MPPEFSIVVPVYMVRAYIHEALRSVARQTYGLWECWCVDDGSADGGGDHLDEAVRGDGRFHVIHQRNAGVAAARNRALGRVRGRWLLFLDGDDAVAPTWLATIRELDARYPDADMIAFRMGETWGDVGKTTPRLGGVRVINAEDGISLALARHSFGEFAYRMPRGGAIRFRPFTHSEDVLFMTMWFCRARRVVLAEIPLYWYRRREGSATTSSVSVARLQSEWGAWSAILGLYVSGARPVARDVLRNCEKVLALGQMGWMARLSDRQTRVAWYRRWRWALLRMAWGTHGTTIAFRTTALLFWATPWYTVSQWFVGRCVRLKAWSRSKNSGARDFSRSGRGK